MCYLGKDVAKELDERREKAQKFRIAGVSPSAGIVVFNQLDKKKTRRITLAMISELLEALTFADQTPEDLLAVLDVDKDGSLSEVEWLDGLDKVSLSMMFMIYAELTILLSFSCPA